MRNLFTILMAMTIVFIGTTSYAAKNYDAYIVLFENSDHCNKNGELIDKTEIKTPTGQTFIFNGYAKAPKMSGFSTKYFYKPKLIKEYSIFSFLKTNRNKKIQKKSRIKIVVGDFSLYGYKVTNTKVITPYGNTASFKGCVKHEKGLTNTYTAKSGSTIKRVLISANGDKRLLD